MKTAAETILTAHTDELAARRTADAILHLLRDFIPHGCEREAWDKVAEVAYKEGWELTNKAMRKEYESWKITQVEFVQTHQSAINFQAQDPRIVGFPPER